MRPRASDVVRQAAAVVAQREGLAQDWLNDAVKGFLPGPDPEVQPLTRRRDITLTLPSKIRN